MPYKTFVLFFAIASSTSYSFGASFPCAKAASKVEKIICSNEQLSQLDSDLAVAYRAKMQPARNLQLQREQTAWLKTRDRCSDAACLFALYNSRIAELAGRDNNAPIQTATGNCYVLRETDADDKTVVPEPVCRALEKNLNQFCSQPPMACGLKIAPEFQGKIVFPEWQSVDLDGKLDLLERLFRSPWIGSRVDNAGQMVWDERRPALEAALAKKRLSVSSANLDLYNLGKTQLAYRTDYGDCQESNPQLADRGGWNEAIAASNVYVQHSPNVVADLRRTFSAPPPGGSNDIFFYRDKTYSFFMAGKESYPNWLVVQRYVAKIYSPSTRQLTNEDICVFDYYAK